MKRRKKWKCQTRKWNEIYKYIVRCIYLLGWKLCLSSFVKARTMSLASHTINRTFLILRTESRIINLFRVQFLWTRNIIFNWNKLFVSLAAMIIVQTQHELGGQTPLPRSQRILKGSFWTSFRIGIAVGN